MKGKLVATRYQLQDRLGVGGSSAVFRAIDRRLDVPVAIKLLDPNLASNEHAMARFLHEAKTAARLKHSNVAQSLDCGIDDGVPFIVMELLQGQTLRERLRDRGRLSPLETAKVLSDVAKAIQLAHNAGVIHRDLKPENVFLARDQASVHDGSSEFPVEVVKVLDFGIAKRSVSAEHTQSGAITEPGSLFGTPNYMSPEQIDARCGIDNRADIWAFGVMAFECLIGRVPFEAPTLRELFLAICARPLPVPSSFADVPSGFDPWFARAAAQDVERRFSSIREAQRELVRVCSLQDPWSSSPEPTWAPESCAAANPPTDLARSEGHRQLEPIATPATADERPARCAVYADDADSRGADPLGTCRASASRPQTSERRTEPVAASSSPAINIKPLPARFLNWLLLLGLFAALAAGLRNCRARGVGGSADATRPSFVPALGVSPAVIGSVRSVTLAPSNLSSSTLGSAGAQSNPVVAPPPSTESSSTTTNNSTSTTAPASSLGPNAAAPSSRLLGAAGAPVSPRRIRTREPSSALISRAVRGWPGPSPRD